MDIPANCFVTDHRGQPIQYGKGRSFLVYRNTTEQSKRRSFSRKIQRYQTELKGKEKGLTEKLDLMLKIVTCWFKRAGADINIHFIELQINAIDKKRGLK